VITQHYAPSTDKDVYNVITRLQALGRNARKSEIKSESTGLATGA